MGLKSIILASVIFVLKVSIVIIKYCEMLEMGGFLLVLWSLRKYYKIIIILNRPVCLGILHIFL